MPIRRATGRFAASLVAAVLCLGSRAFAAPSGAEIFRQKCADCHGAQGQGVEGKYADALYGDWALPKLARYIALNMPEDKPESLAPAEADAVAAYIFDAFYSRAAQARLRPARVELAHLTNQQYAITVADLLRRFGGADDRASLGPRPSPVAPAELRPPAAAVSGEAERGLSAVYYSTAQRGRFDPVRLVYRGVDRELEFDFWWDGKQREHLGDTNEFSMQWRGAVFAEETGDYEFIARTPNSLRVWINADLEPLVVAEAAIDVNVSTPENPEHRTSVRLLGGRWYPLAIDYWALPGKAGAPPPEFALRWKPPHGSEQTIPARNLSTAKVKPTFVVRARFSADDSSRGYERSGSVTKAWDEATTSAAFEVANHVLKKIDRFAGTRAGDVDRAAKVQAFAEKFVSAAYRRPLSDEERLRHVASKFDAATDVDTALKRVVLLALKSPQFLYVELPAAEDLVEGRRSAVPSGFTIASRLSFGLWDSAPDEELLRAAADGRLRTRTEIVAQATRMLADPRARAKLREFFHHWLNIRFVEDMTKDAALYPDFTPAVVDDLRTSLHLFLDEVVWSERSDFRELLRADYLVVNERLAEFFGLPAPADGEFARVPAADGARSGVLTHPYLLAAFSYKNTSSPIHRGVFLTRSIAGRALKSPPQAVAFNETEFAPEMTMREKIAKLTGSENCQGCHAVINPLGFSLEWFDAVGRFRREEKGRPIDAASDYYTDENVRVRLERPRDVAEFALASEQANLAFIEQLFHHVVKQPAMAYGPETLPKLRDSFIASRYNLQKLLVEIVAVSALRGVDPAVATHTPRKESP